MSTPQLDIRAQDRLDKWAMFAAAALQTIVSDYDAPSGAELAHEYADEMVKRYDIKVREQTLPSDEPTTQDCP